jgi:hypothetical protein
MPPTGKISDITANLAARYEKTIRSEKKHQNKEIQKDLYDVQMILGKLDIALRRTRPLQQKICKLFYWEKKSWPEILEQIKPDREYISKRTAQAYRRKAIETMARVLMIDSDDYNKIMDLIGERSG